MYECFAQVYASVCMLGALWGLQIPGTGVRYSCELPLGEELNLGPLEE